MNIAVWDTYVTRKDGLVMHFDILVPDTLKDENKIFEYGKKYLASKPFETGHLSAKACSFCHIEQATPAMTEAIEESGYLIIEMEHCT